MFALVLEGDEPEAVVPEPLEPDGAEPDGAEPDGLEPPLLGAVVVFVFVLAAVPACGAAD